METPNDTRYPLPAPDVILTHQIPDRSRMLQMQQVLFNIAFDLTHATTEDIAKIHRLTEGHIHGVMGDLHRWAKLMQEEVEATPAFTRPSYWYEDHATTGTEDK